MKIRILDRILVAIAGLLVLAGCAALIAQLFFNKDVVAWAGRLLTDESLRVWLIIALALLLILGVYCVLILFRHRSRHDKFVMQKTENGELSISLKAMESMVQKCLDPHKELNVQSVRLENQKGGLLIRIRGTVAGGVSIPLTVDALQQQIKQYVTACSGVEVKDIRVQIESSGPEATGSLYAIEAPTARALPSSGVKEEKPAEPAEEKIEEITAEELETIAAEIPKPETAEAEDSEEDEEPTVVVSEAAVAAAEQLKKEAPVEDDDRPMHQRLFSSQEEPCVMPMPPEKEEIAENAAEEAEKAAEEAVETAEAPAEEQAEEKPEEKETTEGSDKK